MMIEPARIRKVHRQMVGLAAIFLTVSALTGLLWAFAPFLYWEDGYMMPRQKEEIRDLSTIQSHPAEIIFLMKERFGKEVVPLEINLKSLGGWLVYQVRLSVPNQKEDILGLLNANTLEWMSPLGRDHAIQLAARFVETTATVKDAALLGNWIHRKQTRECLAWRIRFDDPGNTEIFLDPNSGEILEDQDRIRKLHFFIMDLHQLNFFGFRKTLTLIPGVLLMGMVVTGVWLHYVYRGRQRARQSTNPLLGKNLEA